VHTSQGMITVREGELTRGEDYLFGRGRVYKCRLSAALYGFVSE